MGPRAFCSIVITRLVRVIHPSVDLILSLSKDEVVAGFAFPTSWFDKLTMRSPGTLRTDK